MSDRSPREMRDSALLFLRYADPIIEGIPGLSGGPVNDPVLIKRIGLERAKAVREELIRSVPIGVLAMPWQLFSFRNATFADLSSGLPKSLLFLMVAFYFVADVRYVSIGDTGLFRSRMPPAVCVVRTETA